MVTPSAYILFYRRRSDHLPLGGPKLEELLAPVSGSADSDEGPSREPSPGTGEGRRLDDSSHNGSSGPGVVGAAHQLGVGGLGSPSHDLSVDNGTHSTTIQEVEDEGYEEGTSYGPGPWDSNPGWGFDILNSQDQIQQPQNSEDEISGDAASQDSTRVAGGGSLPGDEDTPMFSDTPIMGLEDDSDRRTRGVRESAPPPDVVFADDDEEDLPVMELRPGDGEDMDVSFADK